MSRRKKKNFSWLYTDCPPGTEVGGAIVMLSLQLRDKYHNDKKVLVCKIPKQKGKCYIVYTFKSNSHALTTGFKSKFYGRAYRWALDWVTFNMRKDLKATDNDGILRYS